jgi:DNA-binding MarR family transcriptional regulator
MADKPKPGSFSAYLDYMQRENQPVQSAAPASPVTILEILARQAQRTLPLADLQTLSRMDPSRFREALKSLLGTGYIAIEGAQLDEVVKLTDKGAEVARLARPA